MKVMRLFGTLAAACLLSTGADAPSRWFDANSDVGATPAKGTTEFDAATGAYRIAGGGANIWGNADAFQFAWKQMSGDFSITADIHFVGTGAVAHRKAALMIRQSLDADAAYADVALHGDGSVGLQTRSVKGGDTVQSRSELTMPGRVRIERRGDRFTIYAGEPGQALKPTGPATVVLKDPVYVGLAVCAHHPELLETAIFSNVKVESMRRETKYRSKVSIYDLHSGAIRTVYTAEGVMEAPNWSRDGKSLLVNADGHLYRLALTGGAVKPEPVGLDPKLRCNNDHDLSKDGAWIALSASSPESRQSQVYVAKADGTEARLLVAPAPSYFHGWAPDGKYLAFVGQRDGKFNLFRVPFGGGAEERLTSNSPYDDGPDYSPDGKWIYFNSNRSGSWHAWRMPATGAGAGDALAQQVTNDELEDWFPHPSPDGKKLLVFSFPKGTTGHNDRMDGVQLRLMTLPGAKLQPAKLKTLATFYGGQGTINVNSWSPDSKSFAFVIFEPVNGEAR